MVFKAGLFGRRALGSSASGYVIGLLLMVHDALLPNVCVDVQEQFMLPSLRSRKEGEKGRLNRC